MLLPKFAIGIIFSTIGLISFTIPQTSFSHTPLANLLPFITATPTPKEIATLIPSHAPTPTFAAQTLGYATHVTPTPTQRPTAIPTQPQPTNTPVPPVATPTPTTVQTSAQPSDDVQAFIMQAINDYRHSNGLGSVQTNSLTCNFAQTRAQEITTDFSHAGFTNRLNAHTLPYPNYSLVTENIAQTSNYKDVVNLWANSPGHAANMRADTPYICVERSGDYYAMEGWKGL